MDQIHDFQIILSTVLIHHSSVSISNVLVVVFLSESFPLQVTHSPVCQSVSLHLCDVSTT